jgi:nucleoid DNA-binding protein
MVEGKKMLKKDLIKAVAQSADETEVRVRRVMGALEQVVKAAIAGGESVMLAGLGKLMPRPRGAKRARNMVTGESVMVEPRTVVLLKPSDGLLAAANGEG